MDIFLDQKSSCFPNVQTGKQIRRPWLAFVLLQRNMTFTIIYLTTYALGLFSYSDSIREGRSRTLHLFCHKYRESLRRASATTWIIGQRADWEGANFFGSDIVVYRIGGNGLSLLSRWFRLVEYFISGVFRRRLFSSAWHWPSPLGLRGGRHAWHVYGV